MKYLLILCSFCCIVNHSLGQIRDSSSIKFDHLVFFVKDSSIEKQLNEFLTPGEKLTTSHENQGTRSKFYLFYNTYVELIYPVDTSKIISNATNFGSQYLKRWESSKEICRLGIGLILHPFDSTRNHFHPYHSKDQSGYYLMGRNNSNASDAFIYYSPIQTAYHKIDSIQGLKAFYEPPFLHDFENYCRHSSGIKKLTKIIVEGPSIQTKPQFRIFSEHVLFELKDAAHFHYTLEFDTHRQKKNVNVCEWLSLRY